MFSALSQCLILLAGSVFLVTVARRLALPTSMAYLLVGLAIGPYALGVVSDSGTTRLLAELGVAFLLFTLGLEFSLPRMLAMRREVFGLGAAQVALTASVFALLAHFLGGVPWLVAVVLGGAISMSSTAILLQQLTERSELNRTHGRLAFAMLLFQDLAFVPFLALGSVLVSGEDQLQLGAGLVPVLGGVLAIGAVLAAGRWLLRPLFHVIAHSRLRELFTLTVLLVVLSSAWICHSAGLSFALGAFLAGMMLAETEYRHQIEAVIRPFRDILLGLFFISVGMLLDLRLLGRPVRAGDGAAHARDAGSAQGAAGDTRDAAVHQLALQGTAYRHRDVHRRGVRHRPVHASCCRRACCPRAAGGRCSSRWCCRWSLSPLILNNNKRVARWLLGEQAPLRTASDREESATHEIAEREQSSSAASGASARTSRACSSRRASSTSRSTSTRRASAPPARRVIR